MKKNTIFSALLLVIVVLLFLLKVTGMTAHIVLSVLGLALLVVYTVMTKKEWKKTTLEILMRVFYAIALISGVIIMNVHGAAALAVVHKICAALFVVLLVVLYLMKSRVKVK